jgi:hypothetical protein
MAWDLALPPQIMLSIGIFGVPICYSARKSCSIRAPRILPTLFPKAETKLRGPARRTSILDPERLPNR